MNKINEAVEQSIKEMEKKLVEGAPSTDRFERAMILNKTRDTARSIVMSCLKSLPEERIITSRCHRDLCESCAELRGFNNALDASRKAMEEFLR